jgi:hypothetical protein
VGGPEGARDHVEYRRLSSPIGSDQTQNFTFVQVEIKLVYGENAPEAFG